MSAPPWLWVVLTLAAATAQTCRNGAHGSLTPVVGTIGATHVRFLFGLPFALLMLALVAILAGPLPQLNAAAIGWAAIGALGQVGATALMLAVMKERSF